MEIKPQDYLNVKLVIVTDVCLAATWKANIVLLDIIRGEENAVSEAKVERTSLDDKEL